MSSLAATQADGYYVPVEYYESGAYKRKSKNQWFASNKSGIAGGAGAALSGDGRDDASSKGDDVVRFELPYDGICESCQSYIKRGTRFNATKRKVGAYYTTPIYEFRMRCRACSTVGVAVTAADNNHEESLLRSRAQEFVLRVNPSEFGFDYLSGIRKHQRDFVADPTDHCASIDDQTLSQMEVLEQQQHYVQKHLASDLEFLQQLKDKQSRSFLDADGNAALRAAFRPDRKRKKRQLASGVALGWRSGLELLEDSTVQDVCDAKTTVYGDCRSRDRDKWRTVRGESIFARKAAPSKSHRRRRKQIDDAVPDAVPSSTQTNPASRSRRRGSRHRAAEVVDLVEPVANERRAPVPKEDEAAIVKKRRTRTLVASGRSVGMAPVPDAPAEAPVAVESAAGNASSMASLLAGYDSSSSSSDA